MTLRAVAFIDGNNLHYQLGELQLQEKDINWSRLLADAMPPGHRLIRAYWYQVGQISFSQPYPSRLHDVFASGRTGATTEEELRLRCEAYIAEQRERLDRIHREVYDRIAQDYDFLEFRYVGSLKIDPYEQKWVEEKGVDVGMAVDMVGKLAEYDAAVVISGDVDFAPAIQVIKDRLRQAYLVNFAPGTLAQSRFTAGRLRVLADSVRVFNEVEVRDRYLSTKAPPPRHFVRPVVPRATAITPWEPPPEPPNGV
ncbi:MAG: NYN domain-containing protein [Chloroflexi bacterium]|nr:NYN domain-containing protein [Chloroflexota bacterium]